MGRKSKSNKYLSSLFRGVLAITVISSLLQHHHHLHHNLENLTQDGIVRSDRKINVGSAPKKVAAGDIGASVLVTGGAGFIGMHTSIELKERGFKVVALDNMNDYYSVELKEARLEQLLKSGVSFVKGDICDGRLLRTIFREHSVDRVVHLAAQAGVRYSLKSPNSYTKNNVDCFVTILEEFVKEGLHKKPFVYASSSSVYGFDNVPPFAEEYSDVDHPASLYAATKRADELIAYTYNHLYNVSSIGLRFFTVYGPYGRPDMSPMIFAKKIQNNETLNIFNNGKSTRDFTYISDIVEGIIATLSLDLNKRSEVINLGGNKPINVLDFVRIIEKNLQKTTTKKFVPLPSGDIPLTSSNVEKAAMFLDWLPRISTDVGVKLFIKWFKEENAGKYVPSEKEVCIITASFAQEKKLMDEIWDVREFVRKDDTVAFYLFSNHNLDLANLGWKTFKLDLEYRRMITQSRWPKFMAWKISVVEQTCKTVFYIDASSRPKKSQYFLTFIHQMKTKVLDSTVGFAIPRHSFNKDIMMEFKAIRKFRKDVDKNINASLTWLQEQDPLFNQAPLYTNTYFMYQPTSRSWQRMTEYFWDHYALEQDSWRDQPLISYALYRFNYTPVNMPNDLMTVAKFGHNGHVYTEDEDFLTHFSDNTIQAAVTKCDPITDKEKATLQSEIEDYQKSEKFLSKIREAKGEVELGAHHKAIMKYLKEKVLQPKWSILDLGCAAGAMLKAVKQAYEEDFGIGSHNHLVGIELTTGWVKFAQGYYKDISIYEGDVTDFQLPVPYKGKTFDFVMLNDVVEHIQKERYECFFLKLKEVTHSGSIVYMHTPTPQAQIVDKGQYFENVLPHHYLIMGMALAGFELVTFEHDLDTKCGTRENHTLPVALKGVKCMMNKWPKYYHSIFRKTQNDEVFNLA